MKHTVMKLEGITRDFFDGKQLMRVLKKTDLELLTGEMTVLAGPSGSGKTTLLSIMGLILTPSEGRLWINQNEVSKLEEEELASIRLGSIGFVFQQAMLVSALSVMENILIAHSIQGRKNSSKIREKARHYLESFGLAQYENAKPESLSSGQKQRVAVARALINEPVMLLCDEPTSALDAESSQIVLDTLKSLSRDERRGLVLVTHDPRVFPYADRLIKIENGTIVYDSYISAAGENVPAESVPIGVR